MSFQANTILSNFMNVIIIDMCTCTHHSRGTFFIEQFNIQRKNKSFPSRKTKNEKTLWMKMYHPNVVLHHCLNSWKISAYFSTFSTFFFLLLLSELFYSRVIILVIWLQSFRFESRLLPTRMWKRWMVNRKSESKGEKERQRMGKGRNLFPWERRERIHEKEEERKYTKHIYPVYGER